MKQNQLTREESIGRAMQAMQANRPLRAEEICRDYLELHPGCAEHLRLLGHALIKQNRLAEAEEQIRFALELRPEYPQLLEDLGSVLGLQRRFEESIPFFEKAIALEPTLALAHKKLGRALAAVGRGPEADEAFMEFFERDPDKGRIAVGADHLKAGRTEEAVKIFRGILRENPDQVDALCFLALAYRQKESTRSDAEALLRRATQVAPNHVSAWLNLGALLAEMNKRQDAIRCFERAVKIEPGHAGAWGSLGSAYAHASFPEKSVRAYRKALKLDAGIPNYQMGLGHVLKTIGDQEGALQAYREAIRLKPQFGEVYWSMANLKIFRFEDAEVDAMLEQVERDDLSDSEDIHFRFALGKAFEDRRDHDQAWHYYHTGNQRKRSTVEYDPAEVLVKQQEICEVFDAEFLGGREGNGCQAPDPILIVGMPRSGSTLVEQILASHSQVEGTAELPYLGRISASIGRYRTDNVHFPQACRDLRDKDWRAYGEQYLEYTRDHRETDRPFFTDKLPNNFPMVGLLHMILPNARVINTLRHPLDSLLGNYKQLYGKGQNFTYDIYDLAEYYKRYHATMQHWHEVLPGKVLDVHYEDTVLDLEGQVRRILDHCGLEFEEACLRFHENPRSVKTASSEQVRQPIYQSALGTWRRYEKHLGFWQEELADIIAQLPERVRNAGL
ncbi:MAG: tetratricopeptide repeat protein [Xanthomonadales bacterium]|nr:tetratricopeptide repeat protein [Xanthomonadales bacterium]NIX14239.1 tetratricopeptide repeat protein [Xanthomonadales bacterium]